MADIRIVETIDAVDPAAWDACLRAPLEGHACLRAVEQAGLAGFAFRYVMLEEGGRLLGAVPLFLTRYRLETTLEGGPPPLVAPIRSLFPAFLAPKLACIGSPCTETATLGLSPRLPAADRATHAARLLAAVEDVAMAEGAGLIGVKDLAEADMATWGDALAGAGFTAVPGLPTAALPIDFADVDAYLARLSPGTRRDMRRKLRAAPHVRIETRTNVDDVIDRMMALYAETLDRADMRFETLTADYFRALLAAMPGRAFANLYWVGDDLLAFNLLLRDGTTLIDKYFCMEAARGRAHALYFLSWFANIRHCLDHGLSHYVAGQAGYAGKMRLGSRLEHTTMFFRHRRPLLNRALRLAAPHLAPALEDAA